MSRLGGLPFDLAEHVEHFRARVLQDALAEATAAYWERRAETFEAVGLPEAEAVAVACRRHAALVRGELYAEVARELFTAVNSLGELSGDLSEVGRWAS